MAIDAALGRLGIKSGVCTSSTRPTNPYSGQLIYETDTNRTLVYDNSAWLVVADNQVLSIDSANGRVGVGTTSPARKLHVKSNNEGIRIEDGSATDHYDIYRNDITGFLEFTGSQTSFSGYDFEVNSGTNVMRINNSGNIGIGDTSPSYKLDVNGDINTTGSLRIGGKRTGVTLLASGTFSSAGSAIVSVFSSDYKDYIITASMTHSFASEVYYRMMNGGAWYTSSVYETQRLYAQGTSVGGIRTQASSLGRLGYSGAFVSTFEILVSSPYLVEDTVVQSKSAYGDNTYKGMVEINHSYVDTATSFDGIFIGASSGGTLTGRYEVYGVPT